MKTVSIIFMKGYDPERCFYNYDAASEEYDGLQACLRDRLHEAGYQIQFSSDGSGVAGSDALLTWEIDPAILQNIQVIPIQRRFLLTFEPPSVRPDFFDPRLAQFFGKIFTMFQEIADGRQFIQFQYPCFHARMRPGTDLPDFSKRKLCAMVTANKFYPHPRQIYSERAKVISYFAHSNEFDLYGHGWQGAPNWKGWVPDKIAVLKNYRFNICYENTKDQYGYITERIFEPMIAGCVPIYWGASDIARYVPKECFVDRRDFASYDELYRFMKTMTPARFESYVTAARAFLQSPAIEPFRPNTLAKLIVHHLTNG